MHLQLFAPNVHTCQDSKRQECGLTVLASDDDAHFVVIPASVWLYFVHLNSQILLPRQQREPDFFAKLDHFMPLGWQIVLRRAYTRFQKPPPSRCGAI